MLATTTTPFAGAGAQRWECSEREWMPSAEHSPHAAVPSIERQQQRQQQKPRATACLCL